MSLSPQTVKRVGACQDKDMARRKKGGPKERGWASTDDPPGQAESHFSSSPSETENEEGQARRGRRRSLASVTFARTLAALSHFFLCVICFGAKPDNFGAKPDNA